MKIVFLSDTHGRHNEVKLPEGDIIIHAGDISMHGRIEEIKSFLNWYDKTPYKVKYFIAGNHDHLFQKSPILAKSLVEETDTVVYLQDELAEFEGVKIWGSPWQPWYYNWSFNFSPGNKGLKEAEECWSKIPLVDILITHGPMKGVGDRTEDGYNAGCPILYEKVMKVVRPKYFCSGHIHEQGGNVYNLDGGTIKAINASVLNRQYRYTNDPIVIEI